MSARPRETCFRCRELEALCQSQEERLAALQRQVYLKGQASNGARHDHPACSACQRLILLLERWKALTAEIAQEQAMEILELSLLIERAKVQNG